MTNIFESIYPTSNNSSSGIFSFLENKEPELYFLDVTGSPSSIGSDSNPFDNVYTPSKKLSWWSSNTADSFFQINFHTFKVRITHFAFSTFFNPNQQVSPCAPVDWKIEGFDGNWFLIQQYHSNDLHVLNYTKVFTVDNPVVIRGIKLTQIGKSSRGGSDYYLAASKFDIFGDLYNISFFSSCNSMTCSYSCLISVFSIFFILIS